MPPRHHSIKNNNAAFISRIDDIPRTSDSQSVKNTAFYDTTVSTDMKKCYPLHKLSRSTLKGRRTQRLSSQTDGKSCDDDKKKEWVSFHIPEAHPPFNPKTHVDTSTKSIDNVHQNASIVASAKQSVNKPLLRLPEDILDQMQWITDGMVNHSDSFDKNDKLIFRLDSFIREHLSIREESNIMYLELLLGDLIWISNNSADPVDKILAKSEIDLVRKRIKDEEFGFNLSFYILRTEQLLAEYKNITRTSMKTRLFFCGSQSNNSADVRSSFEISRLKTKLLLSYLSISREYIDFSILSKAQKSGGRKSNATGSRIAASDGSNRIPSFLCCDTCGSKNLFFNEDDLTLLCSCGSMMDILDDSPTFKDSERVNMSTRYTYTCRGHFIEAMNCFEGKQNVTISNSILNLIKREIALHNIDIPTKDHVYMFLSENRLSDHYANINLIYLLITNITPPDITDYRTELLEMHDQLEEAYQIVKDNERLNSLNVNWKLYKLLQLLGYPCRKDDFFCLRTTAKQVEHEEKWQEMVEHLSKIYPNATTSGKQKRWRLLKSY